MMVVCFLSGWRGSGRVRHRTSVPLPTLCPLISIEKLPPAVGDPIGADERAVELDVLPPRALGDPVGADKPAADECAADECAVELEVLPPVKTNLLYTNTPTTANTAAAAMRMIGFRSRCAGDPTGG
jgi:hypothetical protein